MVKHRLQSILEIAEATENTAAQAFSSARSDYAFNQEKLRELRSFRDDYEADTQNKAFQASAFQSTRKFLSQLCVVIDQQELEVARTLDQMNHKEQSWMDKRVKRLSVEKLAEKKTEQLAFEQKKREQNEMDEIAMRSTNASGSNP